MQFTLESVRHQADFRFLNLYKLNIGPVSLKRLQFTPGRSPPIKQRSLLVNRAHLNAEKDRAYQYNDPLPPLETGYNHRLQHVAEVRVRLEKECDFKASIYKK